MKININTYIRWFIAWILIFPFWILFYDFPANIYFWILAFHCYIYVVYSRLVLNNDFDDRICSICDIHYCIYDNYCFNCWVKNSKKPKYLKWIYWLDWEFWKWKTLFNKTNNDV